MKNLTRSAKIRLLSYAGAAFLLAAGIAAQGWAAASAYRREIETIYQSSLRSLAGDVMRVQSSLEKATYVSSPSLLASLANQVYNDSSNANAALSRLPLSHQKLEQTSKFLSQAGDYMIYAAKKSVNENAVSDEDREAISGFSNTAITLAEGLLELQREAENGELTFAPEEKPFAAGGREPASPEPPPLAVSAAVRPPDEQNSGDGIMDAETDYPGEATLIYDGPFSDHIETRESVMLANSEEVTAEDAREIAGNFFSVLPAHLTETGGNEGKIRTYAFTAKIDDGEMYVEVTRAGGYVLNMLNSRQVTEQSMSPEEAAEEAGAFLKERGFTGMQKSYWAKEGNILNVNFASVQDGVYCYPDIIKVSVALDSGKIVGYDASGYIMNHVERNLPEPKISEDEARAKLPGTLSVESARTVIIPSDGLNEIICHEFKCETGEGKSYIAYFNTQTGVEERILILLQSDEGTLTI